MRRVMFFIFLVILQTTPAFAGQSVMAIKVNGVIDPVSSEFITRSIAKVNEANKNDYQALVIELDTPGGLDTSMRTIVKDINASKTPIIVFVSPSGARAASAGVFITMAAHVAAMTPGTNIGAAHPVAMGSSKMDDTMAEKVTNDSVAYIKSLASARGRNAKWAEDAVRKSVSITASEALAQNIIDVVAENINDLLKKIDGKTIKINDKTITLQTQNATVTYHEMGLRLSILSTITNPNVAYILLILGFYGLFFELTTPGAILPGIVGAICLILAFYALQGLPVNYAGLLLIILAIIMFIMEVKIVSHGVLTIGGLISMTIGSLMLFESSSPFLKLSIHLVVLAVLTTAVFFVALVGLAYKAYKHKPLTGTNALIGMTGSSQTDILPQEGMVMVRGELWRACSEQHISKGKEVIVVGVSGLTLKVKNSGRYENLVDNT
ncbi:nodulation efficiency protein D [Candidatus Magnetobacterium bavaricum]|uniref:Nodulation efficiency protein D n=1 Tax=Candidatus Magnetobacterium bavaricum TaxID=29290 RepID=A0A0F3GID8_9BACT|nr:nodulation efficiency protein D [Candidatus Magnetobacterium bavaricum]